MRSSPANGCSIAAVEEERHVRVLLGLGDAQLAQAQAGEYSPKPFVSRSGGKATGTSKSSLYSVRRDDTRPAAAPAVRCEAGEVRLDERAGDLRARGRRGSS